MRSTDNDSNNHDDDNNKNNNVKGMKVVIVGCGQIVTHHITAMLTKVRSSPLPATTSTASTTTTAHDNNRKFHIVAVCDPSIQRRQVIIQQIQSLTTANAHACSSKSNSNTESSTSGNEDIIQEYDTLDDLINDSSNSSNSSNNSNNSDNSSSHQPKIVLSTIDIIFIAVPHDLHERITIMALQATSTSQQLQKRQQQEEGVATKTTYIVLEKPIAITKESCQNLLQYVSTNNTTMNSRLIISEQSIYWPAIIKVKEILSSSTCYTSSTTEDSVDNGIGKIISIASYYYESMRDNQTSGTYDNTATTASNNTIIADMNSSEQPILSSSSSSTQSSSILGWRGSIQRSGGGIIMDGGLHWIRPIHYILSNNTTKCKYRVRKVIGVTCPIPSIQRALGMEGETLGHAIMELAPDLHQLQSQPKQQTDTNDHANSSTNSNIAADTSDNTDTIIATYSACMLASPAVMAYEHNPYFRIIGEYGEIIVYGTGLQHSQYNAGGVRLYNPKYPNGIEMLVNEKNHSEITRDYHRTDFFVAFHTLWDEIYRICDTNDTVAANNTVVDAIHDVSIVLAMYKSATITKEWENVV